MLGRAADLVDSDHHQPVQTTPVEVFGDHASEDLPH